MRGILCFFLLLLLTDFVNSNAYKFTLTLKETNDVTNIEKFVEFLVDMTCGNDDCTYRITFENFGFLKILVNDKECPSQCGDTFYKRNTVNVTVFKTENLYIKMFDFEFVNQPNVVVLGCEMGLFNDKMCTKVSQNVMLPMEAEQYSDDVCICGTDAPQPYCDDKTNNGYCKIGQISWWHDYNKISTTVNPGPPVIISTIIDNVTVTLQESLTSAGINDHKDIIVSAFLNCTEGVCQYKTTVTNYGPGYYDYKVGDNKCTSPTCFGSFLKGHRAPVVLQRKNQNLEILAYQYTNGYPEITVLGCGSGLILHDTCQRSLGYAYFDSQYYNDVVCSCQGAKMGCDDLTQIAVCIGGTLTWWTDAPDSTYPTSSSIATTTFPLQDPNIFDLKFFLSEFTYNGSPDYDKNVTLVVNMTCSAIDCDYSVRILEYAQNYYTIYVNGEECPGSHCASKFSKYHSIPVHLARVSEYLNLFDLEFQDTPNVRVLGCTYGMLDYGGCRSSQYFDDKFQKDDIFCVCQSSELKCDQGVESGFCSDGDPIWWKSGKIYDISSSTSPTTTSSGTWSTTFFIGLNETVTAGTQRVSIETTLECPDSSCTFKITVNKINKDYFRIYQDNADCTTHPCSGTLFQTQSIHIYLRKADGSGVMDLFDLRFKEVVVLNCTDGWLEPGKCLKAKNGDDEMCSCQDTSYDCGSVQEYSSCLSGTPEWWKPPNELSTEASTTSLATSSPSSPSTSQSAYTTTVIIKLSENHGPDNQQISIQTTLRCRDESCTYDIEVDNNAEDYFSVSLDDQNCYPSCHGSFYYTDICRFYVYKGENQNMDLFDLKFKNVTILGCTNGLLESGKCLKAKNGNDEMCSCQDADSNCNSVSEDSECKSGAPLWWQPDHTSSTVSTLSSAPSTPPNQYVTVSASLSEDLTTDPYNFNIVTVIGVMNCTKSACQYGVTVVNQNPDYYLVLRNGEDCPAPCQGTIANGDPSVIITVHRQNQHLNFMEFQFENSPKILIMGCEAMGRDGGPDFISLEDNYQCLHIFETTSLGANKYFDDVCLCKESGEKCDNQTPVGKCTSGKVQWWQDDFSTSMVPTTTVTTTQATTTVATTTEPSTTTVPTTTTEATTTVPSDKFSFEISLTEGRNNRKNQMMVSSEMDCSLEKCDFWIKVDNRAQTWFKVYMGSEECQNQKCSGSVVPGASANVTIYRGTEFLDFFDFQFKNIVVLGCDNGLLDYGSCVRMTKAVSINGQEYIDEICSCRSREMDCKNAKVGVCETGVQTWWRDAPRTSTTGGTSSEATTVPTTTAAAVPSLQDLANGGVDLSNVTQVLNDTEHYSKQGMALNHTQIFDITKILHNSANLPGISQKNAIQILQNMDQCLNAHKEQVRRGQTREFRLLAVLQPMVMNTKDKLIQYLDGKNLGFNAKKVNCQNENHTDDGLIDYGRDIGFAVLNDTNKLSSTQHNSIIVPLGTVCQDSQDISHVFFTIFRGQKLFRGPQAYRSYGRKSEEADDSSDKESSNEFRERWKRDAIQPNETEGVNQIPAPSRCVVQPSVPDVPVMSATLMSGAVQIHSFPKIVGVSRPPMAKLQFNTGKIPRPLHGQKIVTWFDESKQEWALQEKCNMESDENGIVLASCEHLTDFTVLIYGQLDAEQVCSWPLIIIGYSVNGASIFCLLLLIVIGLLFYIQTDTIRKILSYIRGQAQTSGDIINLSYYCIFLMFFVLSLFFMDQSSGGNEEDGTTTYCVVIAAMSYFSLISAIMMSMLIGIRMICHFFSPKLRAFFKVMTSPPAALSIGVIIPFTLTLTLALSEREFFERNDAFCWVRPDYIAYAVIVPVILPIINGVICSTFAIYKMFFQAKRGLRDKETSHYDAEFWSKVLGLIIMQFAMGLPWGIEFILIGVAGSSAWNYVFVILLGTQGIDLFLIFLYRRQRLVNESRKWSAREEKMERKQRQLERSGEEG